jgi:hypothetical protein
MEAKLEPTNESPKDGPLTAEYILSQFNQPGDFTISSLRHTIMKVYHDALSNQKNSTLNNQDYYTLFELGEIIKMIDQFIANQKPIKP